MEALGGMRSREHLALANEVRVRRAADKKLIQDGTLDAAGILRSVPVHWRSAELSALLCALPYVGQVKARRWCHLADLTPETVLGGTTSRQRHVLARQVDVWLGQHSGRTLEAA